ncbi:unnamed protein product [Knipowitschia caucasica]|uniref:Uncharacterized protein n=1 Tax=Knipowitschia caucasica TaxID=637954 RepID=A0AAV2MQJ1_KNICA
MFLRSGRVKVYDFNPHFRTRLIRRIYWTQITNIHRHAKDLCGVVSVDCLCGDDKTYSFRNALDELHKCAVTSLKNTSGKYVKLGGIPHKLVATDTEDKENLEIWKYDTKVAFCFKDRQGRPCVVSVDENDNFKLIKTDTEDAKQVIEGNQQKSIWFEINNPGAHGYCIKMAERDKYWAIDKTRSVTLTDSAKSLFTTTQSSNCQCEGCPRVMADVSDAR